MTISTGDNRPLSARVHDQIASDIVNGTLEPGSAIIQEQVAAQYGVSRTPVRDALAQIALEGLATLVPGSGYVVNDLTQQDVANVFEVRHSLENLALAQAAGKHSPAQLVRLRAIVDEFETLAPHDADGQFRLNREFHLQLVAPCPNGYLLGILQGIWDHPIQRRITNAYEVGAERQESIIRAHRGILNALSANDIDGVVEYLVFCHDGKDVPELQPR